jgi:hypothetical protein
LSITLTILVQSEVQPFTSVTVSESVNELLQPLPAKTDTDCPDVLPGIVPLPEMPQLYAAPAGPVYVLPDEEGQIVFAPEIEHVGGIQHEAPEILIGTQ